jgi:hypothetical protein
VYVVWRDGGDIFFRSSDDSGATFGDAVNLSSTVSMSENTVNPGNNDENASNTKRSDLPQIAVSDDHVYVVWADYIPGDYDIRFRSSDDNGSTFGSAINVETSSGLADLPQIAASMNNVYVLWDDYSVAEGLAIFFRASNDNGSTFGSAMNLIRNVGYSNSAPVVVAGNHVYVVSAVGNIDIFLSSSNDNGSTFGSAVNISDTAEGSADPQMAVSGSNVYVVWEEYDAANSDIFFMTFTGDPKTLAAERMMMLSAEDGSMKVGVTTDRDTLETEQPVRFMLKFLHPMTEETLHHVNYSFMIMDEDGNDIINRLNMHAHEGTDTQSVMFSNTGSFTLLIEITGLGLNQPYDSRYNGMVSTTLTVVPEFPLGVLAVMGVVLGTAVAVVRSRHLL